MAFRGSLKNTLTVPVIPAHFLKFSKDFKMENEI